MPLNTRPKSTRVCFDRSSKHDYEPCVALRHWNPRSLLALLGRLRWDGHVGKEVDCLLRFFLLLIQCEQINRISEVANQSRIFEYQPRFEAWTDPAECPRGGVARGLFVLLQLQLTLGDTCAGFMSPEGIPTLLEDSMENMLTYKEKAQGSTKDKPWKD